MFTCNSFHKISNRCERTSSHHKPSHFEMFVNFSYCFVNFTISYETSSIHLFKPSKQKNLPDCTWSRPTRVVMSYLDSHSPQYELRLWVGEVALHLWRHADQWAVGHHGDHTHGLKGELNGDRKTASVRHLSFFSGVGGSPLWLDPTFCGRDCFFSNLCRMLGFEYPRVMFG